MKEWRIRPHEWRQMSIDDRAQVMAFELLHRTQEAYRQEWKEEQKKQKEKEVERAKNPYYAAKARHGLD